jgi:sugar O-acyltransferase (sialic acid O-acetyltransferase NeuD family)
MDSEYEVVGFAVERDFMKRQTFCGLPVVPFEEVESHFSCEGHEVFVAVVYTQLNRLRARLMGEAKAKGYRLASFVSPRAFVWRNVEIGEHCFIFEDNTLQPFVRVGNNVVLWSGNHIGHHSIIRDNCFISSHVVISGFCDIGENTFMGVNSSVANNVRIGRDNWISPSVTIMKDTLPDSLYRAKPAEVSRVGATGYFGVAG